MRLLRALSFIAVFVTTTSAFATDDGITAGSPHRGGTLRLVADSSGGTLDPHINYTSTYAQLFSVVYDGLVTFPKIEGVGGINVVADLAEEVPVPQDGGRTWVFTLRQGIRFSNGQEVTTNDVVASMQRIFKVMGPTAGSFYSGIVGADKCLKTPATCTLEGGVVADPVSRTITFHLKHPDSEFLQKLAFPHASIVPATTPPHDVGNTPIPATGPYYITQYDPNRAIRLERNPYFKVWSASAEPDGYVDHIQYDFGLSDEAQITAIENGHYDWSYDQKPQDRLGEIGAKYTSQVHLQKVFGIYYVPMNVNLPPFNNIKARQAVNYAVDRHAFTILFGGSAIASPLCSMAPEELPGADLPCFYTKGASPDKPAQKWAAPDMERARELVRESGTAGQHVTLVVPNRSIDVSMGVYLRNVLQSIGYVADVKPINFAIQLAYIQNTNNKVQISLSTWYADYPSASNFTDTLFGCENFHPGSDSSINISGFCNKPVQSLMDAAFATSDPKQSAELWRQAGLGIMRESPAAPLIHLGYVDLVSARLGNYFYTTLYHLAFSRVWVQ